MDNLPEEFPSGAGVLYIAFGEAYRDLTVLSIVWLRRSGYSGPVRVLTGNEYWPADTLKCEIVRVPNAGTGFATRYYKTRINEYGYDTTLFLDADTLPITSISKIWRELRFSDLSMPMDYHPKVSELMAKSVINRDRRQSEYRCMEDLGLIHHSFYSSGVMLFRRSAATDRLFARWHEEWNRFRHEDQLALVRAISSTGFRVHTLDPRWNARIKASHTIEDARLRGVRILHLRPGNASLVQMLLRQPASPAEGIPIPHGRISVWTRRLKRAISAYPAWLLKRTT